MLNLIRADFYKTIHGKVLKVCFLMMTGWIFLCAYAQKATIGMREYLVGTEVSANYWDSFFNYYPVVFPLIIFCSYYFSNDFRQGTVKHYIEKGLSRWSYFFSKSLRKESKVVQTKKQYGDFSLTALSFASISIFSG